MANPDHIAQLMKGVDAWNAWRADNANISPDLSMANLEAASLPEADLHNAFLIFANLRGANLAKANLSGANLLSADLAGAILTGANLNSVGLSYATLSGADLTDVTLGGMANFAGANLANSNLTGANYSESYFNGANLREAILSRANFTGANFTKANLTDAKLIAANLTRASLVQTDFIRADLAGCRIYGVSAWGVKLEGAKQLNLAITPEDEPEITVDNIEVAQFIYLMLNNQKVRDVIDTITSKVVLILGRFTQERKPVLEALREELRQRKYLPILFDFEKSGSRTTDETITLLARMARFVVADISDAKSVLQELRAIVPDLPSVPVQPIILAMQEEPGMFDFYRNFRSFLNVHRYASQEQLIADLGEKVIRPAELKVLDLQGST
jgi:uncharacterized protein YjbI with pentapeptide repeats